MTSVSPVVARRNVRLLWAVALLGNLNFQTGLWIVYLREQGLSFVEIGFLQTGLSVAMLLVELPAGVAADRFGRRPILMAARVLVGVYMVVLALTADPVLLALGFAAFGAGLAFESGAELALLVESVEASEPPRASGEGEPPRVTAVVGRYYALSAAGLALGLALGGVLHEISWEAVFVAGALAQAVALVLTVRVKEVVAPDRQEAFQPLGHLAGSIRLLTQSRRLGGLAAGLAGYIAVISLVHMFAQDILATAGIAVGVVSALYAVEAVLSMVAAESAGRVEARLGRRAALLGTAVVSLALVASVGSGLVAVGIVGFLLLGSAGNILEPIAQSDLTEHTPERHRATVLSIVSFGTTGLMAVLTPVIGLTSDAAGLATTLLVFGGVAMVLVLVALRVASPPRVAIEAR